VKLYALLAFALVGCDYSANIPTADQFQSGLTQWVCKRYTVQIQDTIAYTVQDSTRACADGTMPFFFEAVWLDTEPDCPALPGYVIGGLGGIRRRFACYTHAGPRGFWP
jgi:hypothetical protein